MTDSPVYEFGDVRVDLRRMTLSRAGEPVALEPKAFDVLRLLIEHRDRLVTKDELLDVVWKDTFVTPNVLTRAVAQLRDAIGDDAQQPVYIETVPKRGYRFVASVRTSVDGPAVPSPGSAAAVVRVLAIVAIVAAIAAGSSWLARRTAPATGSALRIVPQRVTTRMGNDTLPSIAPDGRAVAYVSDRTGSSEIYVIGRAPGSGEIAITNDGGQNVEPAWSPDGLWIAFHSRSRGGIWIVPATGGAARQIVDTGSQPAWSPDGTRLVFASTEGGMAVQSTLWTVRADGSDRRPLTRLGEPVGGHHQPSWSRNGKLVAFSVSSLGHGLRVWIVPASGNAAPRELMSRPGDTPVFGPDDKALYWVGLPNGVWRVPIDPATGLQKGEPGTVLPISEGHVEGLSIARDGTLAYGLGTSDINLWAIESDPDVPPKEPVRLTDDVVRNSHPDYSSTGRVAYMQDSGDRWSVWLMNDDGTHREPLLAGSKTFFPHWSRDGSRLLVAFIEQSGTGTLSWVDPATRRVTPTAVTGVFGEEKALGEPQLSPDSREIAYHLIEENGVMNVWTRPLGGGPQTRVTSDAEAISYPVWSPDGRWLAVEIKRGEHTHIGVVARDGGAVQQLTSAGGQSWPYSWSPDGERIAFAGERDGVWNVYEVSRRTKTTRALTHFTSSSGYVRYPSWSPRGNRIVFERAIQSSSVWVIPAPRQD